MTIKRLSDGDILNECCKQPSCNKKHPQIKVMNLSEFPDEERGKGYTVILMGRGYKCGTGSTCCDFKDATVMFFAPGKECKVKPCRSIFGGLSPEKDGKLLLICPTFVENTILANKIHQYTFFDYKLSESLHISLKELECLIKCLDEITDELKWGIDELTNTLVAERIDIFLNYCLRFYNRQFITRNQCCSVMKKIEKSVDAHIKAKATIPASLTATTLADSLNMSTAYFNDLLCHETGMTLEEYIWNRSVVLKELNNE